MKPMKQIWLNGLGMALTLSVSAEAAEWRQFRGNDSAGKAMESDLVRDWADDRNLLWRTSMPGPGSSSPIVAKGRVFVTSYSGYGVDRAEPGEIDALTRHLVCLDEETGKLLWDQPVSARLPEDPYRGYLTEHGYASSTPATDGETVYVFFGKTGLLAFDYGGKELWRRELGQESSNRRWGSAASPIVVGDHVIVNASEESQSIRALDRKTGEEVWSAEASSLELAYGSPLVAERRGGGHDLVLAVPNEVWGLNLSTGKLRWFAETRLPGNICPSLTLADGVAYGFGGYPSQGSFAVRMGGEGDVTRSHLMWKSRVSSYVASPVFHEGYLYWVTDRGEVLCQRAKDGQLVFRESLPDLENSDRRRASYASLVYGDGHFYAVSRFSGTYVFKAQPEFELVAHNRIRTDRSQFNGSPAVAGGRLYLRSDQGVYAIGKPIP